MTSNKLLIRLALFPGGFNVDTNIEELGGAWGQGYIRPIQVLTEIILYYLLHVCHVQVVNHPPSRPCLVDFHTAIVHVEVIQDRNVRTYLVIMLLVPRKCHVLEVLVVEVD